MAGQVGSTEEGGGTGWEGDRGRGAWRSLRELTPPCLQSILFKEHGQDRLPGSCQLTAVCVCGECT